MEELGSDVVQRDDGLLLWQGDGSPSSTDPHQAGQVVVQGSFAARVAPLVAPVGGERILDLCGAPGGKALHLAHICREASIVVGVIDERGASRTKENIARLGLTNCSVQDVSDLESVLSAEPFDAILLDVPCSNSGVLNRRPFARHRLSPSTQQDLIKAQSKLLLRALRYASQLESHPRVVYSTCSVLSDENEHLVRRCLERSSSYRVAQEIRAIAASAADDGGYAALLQFD
jgi:16S rRNA (cytosine967-C5)-methyltransferase